MGPVSKECEDGINKVAARQLHISDVYSSMAQYYTEKMEVEAASFIMFFKDQGEVKKFHSKRFLKYLKKRNSTVSVTLMEEPKGNDWGTPVQALTSVLEIEKSITKDLEELHALATDAGDSELLHFMKEFMDKQKKVEKYLKEKIDYHKKLEELMEQERLAEQMARESASGEGT